MTQITVTDLFTFMGRELEAMDEIPAGNILGKIYVIFCENHTKMQDNINSVLVQKSRGLIVQRFTLYM